MTTPPAPVPLPSAPSVPIFGRHDTASPTDRAYRRFGLEVEDVRERAYFVAEFDSYADVDGGSLVTLLNAPTQERQAQATIAFLGQHLRDDDGVSADWSVPTEPARDEETGEPLLDDDSGEELYRWHDGALMTTAEVAEAASAFDWQDGSSRRRFGYLSDSPWYRYRFEALQEIAGHLTKEVTGRPTVRPTPSGRGPQPTGRGRRGR